MRDLDVRCWVQGSIYARLTEQDVLECLPKTLSDGEDIESVIEEVCYDVIDIIQDRGYEQADCADTVEICDTDLDDVHNFVRKVAHDYYGFVDADGQVHLFDPEDYTVSENMVNYLENRKKREVQNLIKKVN